MVATRDQVLAAGDLTEGTRVFDGNILRSEVFSSVSLSTKLTITYLDSGEVDTEALVALDTTDDTNISTTIYNCTATEAVGEPVYLVSADTVAQADASALATARVVGHISSKPSSTSCRISVAPGPLTASGLTAGAPVFLSDTAGVVSSTPGTVVVQVGIADTTTSYLYTGGKVVG
jgi:hypothetical protein